MIKVENLRAEGFEAAIRGMRNPLNSWNKSDSIFKIIHWDEMYDYEVAENWAKKEYDIEKLREENYEKYNDILDKYDNWLISNGMLRRYNDDIIDVVFIGPNDMDLAQRLIAAGPEHCKFLRQIQISFDLTLPFYVWKEFSTYKVGTTANSCSTMHTIHKRPFTLNDFAHDHMYSTMGESYEALDWLETTIELLNHYRELYLETKDKIYWYTMIQMLPTSYLQKRTITMNYSVLRNIIKQRRHHKLEEWSDFIDAMKELPYAEELLFYGLDDKEEK